MDQATLVQIQDKAACVLRHHYALEKDIPHVMNK